MALPAATRLGRYQVLGILGAGGMGEVYRALDPRLGREVAIKVLPQEIASDPDRLRRFEQEARAVAALNHPHIVTVHDVGSSESTPYVVTELLDGENLREVLAFRRPSLRQVLTWAVQTAQGLAAAHRKGIVHRDLKPENLFLTTDGRIKVLDLGLAKLSRPSAGDATAVTDPDPTRPGLLMGTVAYMSPEQVQALALDGRSDIFSLGVVLYELLARKHPFRRETAAATLGAILHETPAELWSVDPAIPRGVDGIVRRCLEKEREERFQTAHDLALALEAVLQAPAGSALLEEVEERSPYPGLQSFTEKDASVFFGREAEVKALWERIRERKLLALIGPSGAGKTSFVRAGVVAGRPEGWAAVVCTPGTRPDRNLAHALAPQLAGDAEAVQDLLRFDDPEVAIATLSRWRRAHGEALVVVDQLEELFTLNTTDVQERFAAVLGRIASETDVHVLLSLRDDFLIRCCEQSPLVPVLRDLTALLSLGREELRRALVEPARTRGYRFEDELLVEEMVSLVEGNRGALPLLAFAVSRLWEKRDRERKLLTRAAYEEIGGVEGALAQHAEAMMDGIGPGRQIIVRELFRNLVTAHGTRAVAEREELLSAFPEREDAEEVLRRLVEERLLTTYEVEGEQGAASHHRVEVVHESLLRAWPRLVRWQAQDEEGALLRDQLRQAAHLWEEKGRTGDLLWTGTAYREYALWRERYPGTLTALETDFAKAMAEKAQRRRRSRRLVTGSVVAVAVVVAAVTGLLWRRSELARDRAQAEARRAEASKLTALGRAELDRYPTAAVAYARKSLEIADTPEGRRFVVDALWRSPTARILPVDPPTWGAAMSADDRWLAAFTFSADVLLWGEDGRLARAIGGHRLPDAPPGIAFTPGGEALLTWSPGASRIRVVSVPEGREIRWLPASRHEAPSRYAWWSAYGWAVLPEGVQVLRRERDSNRIVATGVEMWPYDGGTACVVGSWHPATGSRAQDATDSHVVIQRGRRVVLRPVAGPPTTPEREIGNVNDEPPSPGGPWPTLRLSPGGDRVAVGEGDGRLAVFPTAAGAAHQPRFVRMPRPERQFAPAFDSSGTRLLWGSSADRRASLWNLEGPPDAEPLVLLRPDAEITKTGFFDHAGDHAVVVNHSSLTFWPVRQPQVRMLLGHASGVSRLTFTRDARWLVSCANDGVRAWPLAAIVGAAHRVDSGGGWCYGMAVSPDGQQVLIGGPSGAYLAPFSGAPGRWLYQYRTEGDNTYNTQSCAFDASGQLAATAPGYSLPPARKAVRVWDLAGSLARSMPLVPPGEAGDGYDWGAGDLAFTAEGQVLASGQGGIRRFDPESGGSTWIWPLPKSWDAIMATSADLRAVLAAGFPIESRNGQGVQVVLLDLAKHTRRSLMSYGNRVTAVALDPSGRALATGDEEGAIRVGPADGSEPHRLCCHVGKVSTVAFSPDGQWVASAAGGEIRLWPTPDLKKAPLHTLPYDELMAKLHALTNLQVVEDAASPTGWKLDVGPFPGWKDVPTW